MTTAPRKDRWMTIRLPKDVEEAVRRQAEIDTRPMSAQVLRYIKEGLARDKARS